MDWTHKTKRHTTHTGIDRIMIIIKELKSIKGEKQRADKDWLTTAKKTREIKMEVTFAQYYPK